MSSSTNKSSTTLVSNLPPTSLEAILRSARTLYIGKEERGKHSLTDALLHPYAADGSPLPLPTHASHDDLLDAFWRLPGDTLSKTHVILHNLSSEDAWECQSSPPLSRCLNIIQSARKLSVVWALDGRGNLLEEPSEEASELRTERDEQILMYFLFAQKLRSITFLVLVDGIEDVMRDVRRALAPFDVPLGCTLESNALDEPYLPRNNSPTWEPPEGHITAYEIEFRRIQPLNPGPLSSCWPNFSPDSSPIFIPPLHQPCSEMQAVLDTTALLALLRAPVARRLKGKPPLGHTMAGIMEAQDEIFGFTDVGEDYRMDKEGGVISGCPWWWSFEEGFRRSSGPVQSDEIAPGEVPKRAGRASNSRPVASSSRQDCRTTTAAVRHRDDSTVSPIIGAQE
ncbi:hypothetical protein BU26DRAFT_610358 [Trematosphaeria pertusa]|uniref:Uncharacterized protein n=1 Tax=Trematosphaeria pertusa TaxID=390896 RepID=A0A6A6HV58_9PLEO|nr:uncharacterized protein BU26DRAFT_610358 [Trematosphaeria pertusa]KAF2241976.1 hypothetical protein BU26DRAFT_610358 [Trematosphaeria pertusa]